MLHCTFHCKLLSLLEALLTKRMGSAFVSTVFARSMIGICTNTSNVTFRRTRVKSLIMGRLRRYTMDAESAEPAVDPVTIDKRGKVTLIGLNRPTSRNAVNQDMARQLTVAFRAFEDDEQSNVAVLHGIGEHFCAGYDLKELATSKTVLTEETKQHMRVFGAMGPTHLHISKPIIAAVNGYAVAGGLELALLCDLRVFEKSTLVGFLNRRFGVPLIDGGTVRLPALVGLSNALDLILTGRLLTAQEAKLMGIANRVAEDGNALDTAVELAKEISTFPQLCLRADRNSAYHSVFESHSIRNALEYELDNAIDVLDQESIPGAQKFVDGVGRRGSFH